MSKNEKLAKLRDQELDTQELIGAIDENELKKVAGAGDVNPETTSIVTFIPTTACTNRC